MKYNYLSGTNAQLQLSCLQILLYYKSLWIQYLCQIYRSMQPNNIYFLPKPVKHKELMLLRLLGVSKSSRLGVEKARFGEKKSNEHIEI